MPSRSRGDSVLTILIVQRRGSCTAAAAARVRSGGALAPRHALALHLRPIHAVILAAEPRNEENLAEAKRCPRPSLMYCDIASSDSHRPTFMMAFTDTPMRCKSLAMPARNECGVIDETRALISLADPGSRRLKDSLKNA